MLKVSKMQQSHVAPKKGAVRSHVWGKDALELRRVCYMKPIVNQEEDSGEADSKRKKVWLLMLSAVMRRRKKE